MNRQYFDFSGLIADYENTFTVSVPSSGGYNDMGDYVKGASQDVTMSGAIVAFKESKVLRSDGAISMLDKHLFMLEPISKALIGAEVKYKGQLYKLESETENAEFTGVYSYVLRWCSAFDPV